MTTDFGRQSNKELIDYMKLAESILDDDLYYSLALVYVCSICFAVAFTLAYTLA